MGGVFPAVRYAEVDGVYIAYEVRGDGPVDLVRVPGTMTSLVASFLDPVVGEHYDHLARFSRLIRLDKRGTGLSDPVVEGGAPLLEQQVEDVLAVMNKVGSQRAALYAGADGVPVAIFFAAMHPDRVSALVLNSGWARRFGTPGHPEQSPTAEERDALARALRAGWGDLDEPIFLKNLAPSRLDQPGFAQLLARVQQVSASKAMIAKAWVVDVDVSALLPLVQAETLVLCAAENAIEGIARSRLLAERMPNARLVTIPGADTYFGVHTPEMGAIIEEFLTGTRPRPHVDRALATVLFTDIVSSTQTAASVGDQRWRQILDQHDIVVAEEVLRHNGRVVKRTGDGVLATFDGPARAVRCACAIRDGVRPLGIQVRAGIHTGEVELRDDDIGGIAVHIGARVAALASANLVLVSRTVVDLVVGSGISFEDFGEHELKGVPGSWQLYQADTTTQPTHG
jgi:class 3 adenylate cyclase